MNEQQGFSERNRAETPARLKPGGFYFLPDGGWLRIQGEDRAAFLQRQTTNDVGLLQVGRPLVTVLTSPTARIIDVLILLHEENEIGVITLPGYVEKTARFLRGRIFFMDKVTVIDNSANWAQMELIGEQASEMAAALCVGKEFEGARYLSLPPTLSLGYRLLLPRQAVPVARSALAAAGWVEISAEERHILRVEAGLPAPHSELTEEYTPLEVGLQFAVSSTKGCYTGQEVIARQITYDKVTRRLRGVRLSAPAPVGARLWAEDGAFAGELTSFAQSPRFGAIGLAVIKRPYDETGTKLQIGENLETGAPALVTPLPFA
jgi:folate-binding protein YgfZ